MSKLYFRYGTMGSSKTAQALMIKFNYTQKGFNVLLLKPIIDNRDDHDGKSIIKSRIGLEAECYTFDQNKNIIDLKNELEKLNSVIYDVIIVDEAQFCTKVQIEQLKEISNTKNVLCFGLLTNFKSYLFEGSKRLVELADTLQEIKTVCKCGKKTLINARLINGKVASDGNEILIGGDESYEAMCYDCWIKSQK